MIQVDSCFSKWKGIETFKYFFILRRANFSDDYNLHANETIDITVYIVKQIIIIETSKTSALV